MLGLLGSTKPAVNINESFLLTPMIPRIDLLLISDANDLD